MITAAILASGNGSNAENILRHVRAYDDKIKIPMVITNNKEAGVITRAQKQNVPCAVILRDGAKAAHEEKIDALLRAHFVEWIFLAGYMAILSPDFIAKWQGRIVNIHPSLLPQFPGKDGYGDAFRANAPISGVTLHYVDAGVDTGPIIAQRQFNRLPDDTLDTFKARGMVLEYQLYNDFIDGLVKRVAA